MDYTEWICQDPEWVSIGPTKDNNMKSKVILQLETSLQDGCTTLVAECSRSQTH